MYIYVPTYIYMSIHVCGDMYMYMCVGGYMYMYMYMYIPAEGIFPGGLERVESGPPEWGSGLELASLEKNRHLWYASKKTLHTFVSRRRIHVIYIHV